MINGWKQKPLKGTKLRAVQEGQDLVQYRGFNGFSFQDVADRIGIRKASLYDHFPTKEWFGVRIMDRYREGFESWSASVRHRDALEQIGAFFELFYGFSSDRQKFCPVAALIADFNSLPPRVEGSLLEMYMLERTWLESVIERGQHDCLLRWDTPSDVLTQFVLSSALGAQVSARAARDPEVIRVVKGAVLRYLTAE